MTVETTENFKTPWWAMEPDAVAAELGTGLAGLTGAEAKERQAKYGPNQLTAANPRRLRNCASSNSWTP